MSVNRFFYRPGNRGILQPIIPLGVQINNSWYIVQAYVDSGADYSVFKPQIAREAKLDYRAGRRTSLQVGDGNLIPVYLHDLEIQLGEERFTCPVGFSDRLGVSFNILGKQGIFDKFKICFLESQGIISFES